MAGPIPLLGLLDELRDFANRRNIGQRMVGGGVRGAATRGLLGMDAPENATPIQREVYENAARMSAPAQGLTALKAATVFHGSPHKFTKFDPKKIGTGEGAQSYGHGLYVAESPEVAKGYQSATSKDKFLTKTGLFDPSELEHLNVKAEVRKGDLDKAIELARKFSGPDRDYPETAAKAARDLAKLEAVKASGGMSQNQGAFYKIDLPDEAIARMLDWDKPLSQQPKVVQEALQSEQVRRQIEQLKASGQLGNYSSQEMQQLRGEDFYDMLRQASGESNVAPSAFLQRQGIPGIRYLDQGSRGSFRVQNFVKGNPYGEPVSFMTEKQAADYAAEQASKGFTTKTLPGTSNFVVFPGEEELLRILERNGVPIQSLLD